MYRKKIKGRMRTLLAVVTLLSMCMSMLCIPAAAEGGTPQTTTLNVSGNADLKTAIEGAVDAGYTSATVYLSPGRYWLPQDDNQAPCLKTASIDLTFIGTGEDAKNKVVWVLNPDDPASENAQPQASYDSAFRNSSHTFAFQNMTLEVGPGGYTGFHSNGNLEIRDCIVRGGTLWYCGGAEATITDTEFITDGYAIQTYCARKYHIEGCTFRTGKGISLYSDMKQNVEVIFKNNTVTEWDDQSVIKISDHANASATYIVRFSGTNVFTVPVGTPNGRTCSRWYDVGKYMKPDGTVSSEQGTFASVYMDGALVWANGAWTQGHEHDYTDGYAEQAYTTVYTPSEDEWTTDPEGNEVRYWEKQCTYCSTVVDNGVIVREDEEYTVTVNYLDEDGGTPLQSAYSAETTGQAYDVSAVIPDELTVEENHYVKVGVTGAVSGTADSDQTVNVTYGLDNVGEDDDADGQPDEPDNIPDKYQKKVTFRVANGNWNDGTDADRVVYVTLMTEGVWDAAGSGVLTAPAVGEQPDSGYKAGGWDVTPPAQVSGTEDAAYTYTYARSTTPIVPGDTVNYLVEHYKADSDGSYPADPTERELLGGKIGDSVTATPKTYDGYCVNLQAEGTVAGGTLVNIESADDIVVLKLYYDIDVVGEDDDGDGQPDEPDNIPDKYQKKVTFQVANGNWDDGTDADRVVYVTLMTEGVWDAAGSGVLTAPAVGEQPDSGYKAGGWDVTPPAQVSGVEDKTYTYSYERIVYPPVIPDYPPVIIPTVGTVTLTKADAQDNSTTLANVVFDLYRANGRLQGTYTTDADGKITVKNLPAGQYYWVEVRPAEGYVLDPAEHAFTVSGGKTKSMIVTNTRSAVPEVFRGDHYAYVVGYDDGLIHPEKNITRAEVATIFFRLLDDAVRQQYMTKVSPFPDVEEGKWYCTAVSTMAAMGVVNGCPDGNFYPDANITRAEFAAIAARFDTNGNTTGVPFSDIYEHWAQKEINVAYNNGWILGYEDGTFQPDWNITRAEAFALVNRVLQRIPGHTEDLLDDMVTWPDNMDTTKWYYLAVQEATNSHDYIRKESGYEQWAQLKEVRDWAALEQ